VSTGRTTLLIRIVRAGFENGRGQCSVENGAAGIKRPNVSDRF
jgi:hypothetical protein